MTSNNRAKVYLPAGLWYDLWTGEARQGYGWRDVVCDLDSIPIYVRGGLILPLGPEVAHTGEMTGEDYELRTYPEESGQAEYLILLEQGEIKFVNSA